MLNARTIDTQRIKINVLTCGNPAAETILFIHGNLSSAVFWERTMIALQDDFYCLASDLRGFGETEPLKVDATLGLDDLAHDVFALTRYLEMDRFHVVGHSMGGGMAMKMMLLRPEVLDSVTLVNTISPYGYAGSTDEQGTRCYPDGSPGGAEYVDDEFIRRLARRTPCRRVTFLRNCISSPLLCLTISINYWMQYLLLASAMTGIPGMQWNHRFGLVWLREIGVSSMHFRGVISTLRVLSISGPSPRCFGCAALMT